MRIELDNADYFNFDNKLVQKVPRTNILKWGSFATIIVDSLLKILNFLKA